MENDAGLVNIPKSDGPGIHALLIGVSYYEHLPDGKDPAADPMGMAQLSAAARTVADIAKWLTSVGSGLSVPLKSLRVLVSPSLEETAADPTLSAFAPAKLKNVGDAAAGWQRDASHSQDDVTLFYFAGHGIQRSRGDSVLLLEDFLDGFVDLDHTINVNNIYNGMGNFRSLPNLARKQFYFIDACRSNVPKLREYETQETAQIFRVEAGGVDDRLAPIFYAAAAGREAFAMPGAQTVFGRNLLACLAGGAADRIQSNDHTSKWTVTIGTLAQALSAMVNAANALMGSAVVSMNVDKYTAEALNVAICVLPQAPLVPCSLKLIPPAAALFARINFDPPGSPGGNAIGPPCKNPCELQRPAGIYAIDALVSGAQPGFNWRNVQQYVVVKAPFFEYALCFS